MTNPTSNFGWQMPTSTDLVTDLPADFEVFGQAVDTSLADLKGGTTGQVLAKASNTNMDFAWVAQDDSNAIQNAIVDAKGDLIAATAADTPARLAIGTTGQILSADPAEATGLKWITPNPGDITAVNTTAPLQGGATSGAVTLSIDAASTTVVGAVQLEDSTASTSITKAATPNSVKSAFDLANGAIPKSTVTTNGDLIYATGSSTLTRRAIGTTGQVLTVSGGVPTWATPAGGGKVLQVVFASYGTQVTSASSTYSDTGLSATITPSSSSSKILVIVSQTGTGKTSNAVQTGVRLLRGSTTVLQIDGSAGSTQNSNENMIGSVSATYLDSPATTAATTYKTQFNSLLGNSSAIVQNNNGAGSNSTITLMEIGA